MKMLVTGGNGFIGSWAIRRLIDEGYDVRVIDLEPPGTLSRLVLGASLDTVDWRCHDVSDGELVQTAAQGCTAVLHCAGVLTPFCQRDPVRGAMINVIGTLNVFEAARKHGLKKVVYCSSAGVFGPEHADFPAPTTHYGAFKLANEGSARAYSVDAGIDSIGFRPFVVYGPGRKGGASAGVSLACEAAAKGEPYTIPFTGSIGMLYVGDVVDAFVAALKTPFTGAHVFNLNGCIASVTTLMAEIRRQVPDAVLDAQGPPLQICADIPESNLHAVLPGLTTTSLAEGIARSLQAYRQADRGAAYVA